MAQHLYPDESPDRPLHSFINDPSLDEYARKAELLLKQLQKRLPIFVPKVQFKPRGIRNTCWYIALKPKPDVWLINFTIVPANVNIEFRLRRYFSVGESDPKKLGVWHQNNWPTVGLRQVDSKTALWLLSEYIERATPDVLEGLHKPRSRSAFEYVIKQDLEKIFPTHKVRHSERPIRCGEGKPLELDLWIRELKFAIEVQGPSHSSDHDFYGVHEDVKRRDKLKILWCRDRGIRLMHVPWDAYNRTLARLTDDKVRSTRFGILVKNFLASGDLFREANDEDFGGQGN